MFDAANSGTKRSHKIGVQNSGTSLHYEAHSRAGGTAEEGERATGSFAVNVDDKGGGCLGPNCKEAEDAAQTRRHRFAKTCEISYCKLA
jgi:hypothetical protein